MIQREAESRLRYLATHFKAVAVIGPRQSGKTTLVRQIFPDKPYYSMENPDIRQWVTEDPRGFLQSVSGGAVLDEIQHVPALFSYLQQVLDEAPGKGRFILTGSNNFLMQEKISQSLAGRVAYLGLLPFSLREIHPIVQHWDDPKLIWNGFYPPIYDQHVPPRDWIQNYIQTYIERDVRQLKNIHRLYLFERFIRLMAGRTATEWVAHVLASETGVDTKTVQSWAGVLMNSFLTFQLPAYFNNYRKTIVKRPKIYFYDTAIVCGLTGIRRPEHLQWHPAYGQIFESMVTADIMKYFLHRGVRPPIYYWRDKTGHEIDLIIDTDKEPLAVEIKSGQTVNPEWFRHLRYWHKLTGSSRSYLLYGGTRTMTRGATHVIPWREFVRHLDRYIPGLT